MTIVSIIRSITSGFSRASRQTKSRCNTHRKAFEKSFDYVGGSHFFRRGFDHAGVSGVAFELVEVGQMPARAVEQKAEHLLEKRPERQSFFAQPKEGELIGENPEDADRFQIPGKQGEPTAPGQGIRCGFDFSDPLFCGIFFHILIHLLGGWLCFLNKDILALILPPFK